MLNSCEIKNTTISRIFQSANSRIDFRVPLNQSLYMESERFERAMVEVLTAIIVSRGMKHDPVAKAAWPYKKAPGRTWQAIRSNDHAQRLTIKDAHAMATILNVSMSQLCALVEARELENNFQSTPQKQTRPTKTGTALCSQQEMLEADNR